MIVINAKRGCHLKGIIEIPLKFRKPTVAVNNINKKAVIPKYITSGCPKNKINAILWIILLYDYLTGHGRMNGARIIKAAGVIKSKRKSLSGT